MIEVTPSIKLDDSEIQLDFVRASGPGGQNVNKVASAAQLRFNVRNSPALEPEVKERLIKLAGSRVTDEGVLIIGSGNIVHNLRLVAWEGEPFDWAVEFDARVKQWILDEDNDPIIHYEAQGRQAALAVNSGEHYLPLLYVLGARKKGEPVSFFNEKIYAGSLSMRCLQVG